MNNQVHFPILPTERYLKAIDEAAVVIRSRLKSPDKKDFEHATVQLYPSWFVAFILGSLGLVMVFSFFISAGKQVAASSLLFDAMPDKFNRLSSLWASGSIVFMLLLSEAGAVLFLVAAGTIAHTAPKWRGINPTAWVFRAFAMLCAGYAITANVSITLIDPTVSVGVLQWLTSIGIPLTVLGLGMVLERVMIDSLRSAAERGAAFEAARGDYEKLLAQPHLHEHYQSVLSDCLWAELTRLKANRDMLTPWVEKDVRAKRWIVVSEYRAQKALTEFDLEGDVDIVPFLSQSGEPTPPLLN